MWVPLLRNDSMDKRTVLRAVAGGAVGMVVMVLALIMLNIQTRSALNLYTLISQFVGAGSDQSLGFVIFLVVGVLVWPLIFAWAEPHLPPEGDAAVSGMLFAFVIWLAFMITSVPDVPTILLFLFGGYTLLAHLAYGFTLGLVYGWTAPRTDAATETGPDTDPR